MKIEVESRLRGMGVKSCNPTLDSARLFSWLDLGGSNTQVPFTMSPGVEMNGRISFAMIATESSSLRSFIKSAIASIGFVMHTAS